MNSKIETLPADSANQTPRLSLRRETLRTLGKVRTGVRTGMPNTANCLTHVTCSQCGHSLETGP